MANPRNVQKSKRTGQEPINCRFVRGIEYGPTRSCVGRPPRNLIVTDGNVSRSAGSNRQFAQFRPIQPFRRSRNPCPATSAHTESAASYPAAHLGQHRPIAEFDQRMHQRFRMQNDFNLIGRQIEQPARLDDFQALFMSVAESTVIFWPSARLDAATPFRLHGPQLPAVFPRKGPPLAVSTIVRLRWLSRRA